MLQTVVESEQLSLLLLFEIVIFRREVDLLTSRLLQLKLISLVLSC